MGTTVSTCCSSCSFREPAKWGTRSMQSVHSASMSASISAVQVQRSGLLSATNLNSDTLSRTHSAGSRRTSGFHFEGHTLVITHTSRRRQRTTARLGRSVQSVASLQSAAELQSPLVPAGEGQAAVLMASFVREAQRVSGSPHWSGLPCINL